MGRPKKDTLKIETKIIVNHRKRNRRKMRTSTKIRINHNFIQDDNNLLENSEEENQGFF